VGWGERGWDQRRAVTSGKRCLRSNDHGTHLIHTYDRELLHVGRPPRFAKIRSGGGRGDQKAMDDAVGSNDNFTLTAVNLDRLE